MWGGIEKVKEKIDLEEIILETIKSAAKAYANLEYDRFIKHVDVLFTLIAPYADSSIVEEWESVRGKNFSSVRELTEQYFNLWKKIQVEIKNLGLGLTEEVEWTS